MKKCALVTLVIAFSIGVLCSWCSAQALPTVTDTSKEGSLLIWPKIVTTNGQDTYIAIFNSGSRSVDVKCYWEYKDLQKQNSTPVTRNGCSHLDFQFRLTKLHPLVFRASDGEHLWDDTNVWRVPSVSAFGKDEEGVLKCWAVDASAENQISWNYLKGEAIIVSIDGTSAWEYNAYRFAAKNAVDRASVGQAGRIDLNGGGTVANPVVGYDACPSYIVFDFLAESDNVTSDLNLVPCIQNLKQEGTSTKTKATFTIWNQNEVKFTGAHQCFNCYIEASLDYFTVPQDSTTSKIKPFSVARLHTDAARMRVQGLQSNNYCPGSEATPLLGLIDSRIKMLDTYAYSDRFGTHASTAGKYVNKGSVYIQWDYELKAEEKLRR